VVRGHDDRGLDLDRGAEEATKEMTRIYDDDDGNWIAEIHDDPMTMRDWIFYGIVIGAILGPLGSILGLLVGLIIGWCRRDISREERLQNPV
jgi:hypothetical protein